MGTTLISIEEYDEWESEQPTGQWMAPLKAAEVMLNRAVTVAAKPANVSLSSFAAHAKQAGYRKAHWTEKLSNELDCTKVDVKSIGATTETGSGWAGRVAK